MVGISEMILRFLLIALMVLAFHYTIKFLEEHLILNSIEMAYLGPLVLGTRNRLLKVTFEALLFLVFFFIFFMSLTFFWILILGYVDPMVPSILEFIRHHNSLAVINWFLGTLFAITLHLYIENQDVRNGDDFPRDFPTHPATCDSSGGTICERVSNKGEGIMSLHGDHFECPCGKYKQPFYKALSHEP